MVNCRSRVTKHSRRKITFFRPLPLPPSCVSFRFFTGAPSRRPRERIESEVVYADYIVPPPPAPSPLGLLVARVTDDVHGTCVRCIYIVYVCYGIVPAQSGTSTYIIVLEGECMYVRLLAAFLSLLSLFLPLFFSLGRISMTTRDVGVRM